MPYPHTFITLTPKERKQVSFWLEQYSLTGQYERRRRLQVLYLSDQKVEFERIARRLNCSYMTVRRYIYLYRKKGLEPFIDDLPRT